MMLNVPPVLGPRAGIGAEGISTNKDIVNTVLAAYLQERDLPINAESRTETPEWSKGGGKTADSSSGSELSTISVFRLQGLQTQHT